MSNYSGDQFEEGEAEHHSVANNQDFKLKLSVDVRSVKNLKLAANVQV